MKAPDQFEELMAYADGELEGEPRAAVEARVARDPEAARFVASLAELGALVREGHAASTDAHTIASFDVADAVMLQVGSKRPTSRSSMPPRAASNVRSMDDARGPRSHRGRRVPVIGLVVTAFAAAAAVFVVARRPAEAPLAGRSASPDTHLVQIAQTSPPPSTRAGSEGPGVEVETTGSAVSVFYLPGASELSTSVVVWVDESGEK